MKLKDFLTLKVGAGVLVSGTRYSPYINYSWSQTLTVGGNQQIKDTGKAGLNLQQFFGQGCWFNGIDMQITIPVNATIQTEIKSVNGVAEINTNTQVLTNYNVYSGSGAKVYKDLYMFNRLLTKSEIDKYNNNPNQFFMDSLEDSSCVLAMPMCEKDGFVRNYKSYSEGSNFDGVTLASQTVGTGNSIKQNNNVFNITNVISTRGIYYPLVKFNPTVFDSTLYYMEIEVKCITGTLKVNSLESTQRTTANEVLTAGESKVYTNISMFANIGGQKGIITLDGLNYPTFTAEVTLKNIRQLTSIYLITNYLEICRTNAQRLPHGLQTSGFKRDTNGLILSKSNFLEADGVGYGNTGWIPNISKPTTIECILDKKGIDESQMNGADYLRIGVASNNILYFRCGDKQLQIAGTAVDSTYYMVVAFDGSIVTFYVNGIVNTTTSYVSIPDVVPFKLFTSAWNKPSKSPIRLFKVHQKALTQEEIIKNFNKYKAQGLFNE